MALDEVRGGLRFLLTNPHLSINDTQDARKKGTIMTALRGRATRHGIGLEGNRRCWHPGDCRDHIGPAEEARSLVCVPPRAVRPSGFVVPGCGATTEQHGNQIVS